LGCNPWKCHLHKDAEWYSHRPRFGTGSIGTGSQSFSPLLHLKYKYGLSQINWVIITHPHRYHLDDIFNLDALNPIILTRPDHLAIDDIRKVTQSGDNGCMSVWGRVVSGMPTFCEAAAHDRTANG
jgi:hypothetical protein